MRAETDRPTSQKATLSLADEVAAWRSKRMLRHGSTTGKVQVVHISKRVVTPIGSSTARQPSTARP